MRGRGGATSAMRARGQKKPESGARALRKFTCDANGKRKTVHASDGLGHAMTIVRIVRRARVKK
eukprot:745947-Pleurochrysis_carterae.AAC.1